MERARLFSGSFESAIYLLSSICSIPDEIKVLPAINTNFSHHICAGLRDGGVVLGQNAISHPSEPTMSTDSNAVGHRRTQSSIGHASDVEGEALDHADTIEDANWPGSLPVLRKPYISFSKSPAPPTSFSTQIPHTTSLIGSTATDVETSETYQPSDVLPVPIDRLWYINPYGQEIRPYPNPAVTQATRESGSIIYSIGSLYTSLIPSLILRGVGDAIAHGSAKQKILILNGSIDRETCSVSGGAYGVMDFVRAIARACRESQGVYGDEVDRSELRINVTHVIYMEEEGTPVVDKQELMAVGIEGVRVYGRRMEGGQGWRYDERGLCQALEALVGKARCGSRRNTLVG